MAAETTYPPYSPAEMLKRMQRDTERNLLRVRNGIKLMTGSAKPELGVSAKDTVWTYDKVQLWRYRSDQRRFHPPVLLIMSLVSKSYIFDLRPGNSLVEFMLGRGFDVYVLDWGVPDHLEAANTLSTYIDEYMPPAVDAVRSTSDAEGVTMIGYCFGGVLAFLHVAAHPDPIANLVTMAAPVDTRAMGPMSKLTAEGRIDPESMIDETGNVPAEVMLNSFKMLKPTSEVTGYLDLWDKMWDDQYLTAYQAMDGWGKDQIPFPGAAFVEMNTLLTQKNLLRTGTVPIGGRDIHLADIRCPFLAVLGEKDHITPMASGQGQCDLVGSEDKQELLVKSGHVGLFVGRTAHKGTLPPLCDWIEAHSVAR